MNGIGLSFDQNSINKLRQQFDNLISELNQKGQVHINLNKVNEDINKIKLQLNSILTNKPVDLRLNTAQIEGDLKKTVSSIDEAMKHYEQLGKVNATNRKYDENGNLRSFTLELERVDGLFEKINYKANAFQDIGNGNIKGISFNTTGVTELDKTSKITEKILKDEEKLAQQIGKTREQVELRQREEQKLNDTKQADASNKILEKEYQDNIKLAEAIGKTREQVELKRKEEEKQLEINQAKASNKVLDEQYQSQIKEQQRVVGLGEFKTNVDSSVFGKSSEEVKKYVKSLYDTDVEVTKLQKSTDGLGKSIVTATVKTKDGKNAFTEEKVVLDQVTNSMYKQGESIKTTSSHMHDFATSIKMAFQSLASFATMSTLIYGTINQIKEAVSFSNSLNKSQTNIQMIAGYSREQIQGLTKDYSNLSDELYSTLDAMMDGAEEFLRAGNTIEETQSLLKASTIGGAVSGQTNQEMAEQLIAISNGFKMVTGDAQEMMNVIDTLSTLDNNSATSMKEIATALTKTSSSAQLAGVSFKDMATYISVVSSVSRKSASNIGESFKSIFARYQNVKGGVKFDADNEDLSNVERDFQKYAQIAIRSNKGTFKEFDIVMDELAKKWGTLSQVSQSAIAKALAGTQNRENFLVLMSNLDKVKELQDKVTDAAGSSQKKFDEAYGNSTEAKLNKLKNSMQTLYMEMFNSDMINGAVGGLTTFVQYLQVIATSSTQTKVEIVALTVAIVAMGLAIRNNGIQTLNASIMSLIPNLINAVSSGKLLTTVLSGLKAGFSFLLSPVGLITLALGYATMALTSHIQEQKKLKEQTEQLSSSYKDLAEAIKTVDMTAIETNSKPLGDTQEQLQNAMKSKADAEARKKEIQDAVSNSGGDRATATKYGNELSGLDSTINATSKTIKNLTKELTDAGIAFDSSTGEVYKYTEAQNYLKNNQIATEIKNQAEETYNHKQEIIGLIQEYQNLNSIENANAMEKQRMSQIAQELQGTITGLSVARDAEGNYIIQNTDLLGKEISILTQEGNTAQTVANVKLTAAKNEAMIEVGKTKVTYAQAKERMNILLAEAKTARDVANAKAAEAAKELGVDVSFMDGMGLSTGANIIEQRAQEEIGAIQSALSTLDKIYSTGNSSIGVNPIKVGSTDSYVPSNPDKSKSKAAEDEAEKIEKLQEEMKDNVKTVEDAITEIIKKEVEKRKDAIQKEYEARKDAVNKAKELYNETNEEDDFQKELKKEQESLNQINASIVSAQRDTSIAGQSRLEDLIEQQKEQQDKIDEMILDRTRDKNNDMFDQQLDALDKEQENKITELENQYSDENISKMVNTSMITGQIEGIGSVQDAYINFQNTYNQGLTASGKLLQEEFIDKWAKVKELIAGISGVNIGVNFGGLERFKDGGISSTTGLAFLDGTVANPELITNGKQAINLLRNLSLKPIQTPSVNPISRSNGASVNFNEPFMIIQNVSSELDFDNLVNKATDKVTRAIMQTYNDMGIYEHA